MRWRIVATMLAATASAPSWADDAGSRLTAAMDRYVENPRAPGTYRALAGLGDPDFMAESPGQPSNWQAAYDEQQSARPCSASKATAIAAPTMR
jgi:hypothetical protein